MVTVDESSSSGSGWSKSSKLAKPADAFDGVSVLLGDSADGVDVENELTRLAFVPSSDIADDASVAVDVDPGPPAPCKVPTWNMLSVDVIDPEMDWKSEDVVEEVVSSDGGGKLLTDCCCSRAFVNPDKFLTDCD